MPVQPTRPHRRATVRGVPPWRWFDDLRQDIRYACRTLVRAPGFTGIAVLTLATGIGAATSVFGLADALLFRPPAGVRQPSRVVALYSDDSTTPEPEHVGFSYPQYRELRERQRVFDDLAVFIRMEGGYRLDEGSRQLRWEFASGNYFQVLGVTPRLGRFFSEEDDRPSVPLVAVLSYRFWQAEFGGDPRVLGRLIHLNREPVEIVGVAAQGFDGQLYDWYPHPQIWLPVQSYAPIVRSDRLDRPDINFTPVGRLKPTVEIAAAQAHVTALAAAFASPSIDLFKQDAVTVRPIGQSRLWPGRRAPVARLLSLLFSVAVLLLLIGCFNVANFLLGRGAARLHELTVRFSLGATPARILVQLLTESTVLALVAAGVGFGIALLLSRALITMPELYGRITLDVGSLLDSRVLAFAIGLVFVTTATFGLLPAWMASRQAVHSAMKASGPGLVHGSRFSLRQGLLVVQVTFAVTLTTTAGLCYGSLRRMLAVDSGLPTHRVLLGTYRAGSLSEAEGGRFGQRLVDRLRAHPGVQAAAVAINEPYLIGRAEVEVPGRQDASRVTIGMTAVSPGSFDTLGIPLIAGRVYEASDPADGVALIINHVMAERLWPGEEAVGRSIRFPLMTSPGDRRSFGSPERVVVGVVRQDTCRDVLEPPHPCAWAPLRPMRGGTIIVRTAGDPRPLAGLIRDTVQALDRDVVLVRTQTLAQQLRDQMAAPRVSALMTGATAVTGIVLIAVGCVALFTSRVKESQREIAVRMALGATPNRLVQRVVLRATILTSLGSVAGIVLAVGVRRRVFDQLYEAATLDVWPFVLAAALVLLVAVTASYWPARRAARLDPIAFLRYE